jgi:hypothetical protein
VSRWLHALDPLNVPPPDWDLPPAPEGLPPPPPAQAGILDFLSTPLYGYHFKDFATRHFRPHKTDTIQQLITYTKVPPTTTSALRVIASLTPTQPTNHNRNR